MTQLRTAVREIRDDAEARVAEIVARGKEYTDTGGPFPDRLPIIAITGKLLLSQYEAVVRWARWAEDAIGERTVSRRQLALRCRVTLSPRGGPPDMPRKPPNIAAGRRIPIRPLVELLKRSPQAACGPLRVVGFEQRPDGL